MQLTTAGMQCKYSLHYSSVNAQALTLPLYDTQVPCERRHTRSDGQHGRTVDHYSWNRAAVLSTSWSWPWSPPPELGLADLFPHGFFFFSSRRRHTRLQGDWSSDVCSSD